MNRSKLYGFSNKYLVISVIMSVISTSINFSYGFGIRREHLSQLPIIYRVLDSNYLVNDFYVNEASSFIARLGYAHLIAVFTLLAGSIDYMPLIFFLITLISNLVLAIVTFLFARDIFDGFNLSGIIAVALVMSLSTFVLGYTAEVYATTLIPRTIAMPIIFTAVYITFIKKYLPLGIFLCGVASLFQPLYGLLFGMIIFASFFITTIIVKSIFHLETQKKMVFALLIYILFFLLSMIPQLSQVTIDTPVFIYILAYFRNPHHYIPSAFSFASYVFAASFIFAAGTSFLYWRRSQQISEEIKIRISILVSIVFLLCLGGYVFVEIFPYRLWTTAQTFRLLIIVKWLGLIFIGGAIAKIVQKKRLIEVIYYIFSLFNPLLIGFAFLIQLITNKTEKAFPHLRNIFHACTVLMFLILVYFIYLTTSIMYWLPIWFFFMVIFMLVYYDKKLLAFLISIGMGLVMLNLIGVNIPEERKLINEFNQRIINQNLLYGLEREEFGETGKQVANYARENTLKDSVFLTPAYFGQFRLVAERAIVVDFQGFPFSDDGILEWYTRMIDCYGEPGQFGFAAIDELNENYKVIDDNLLVALKDKYDISHAVLFRETKTDYSVLYQNSKFKIIELN